MLERIKRAIKREKKIQVYEVNFDGCGANLIQDVNVKKKDANTIVRNIIESRYENNRYDTTYEREYVIVLHYMTETQIMFSMR